MTQPKPRSEPEGSADVARIDWPARLAEHDHWLRTVIYARVGEGQVVDELMQEVSLAAVRQKAPLHDPSKVASWLYRLAVTQALLYRRSQGRRRKLVDRYARRYRPTEEDTRQVDPLGWLLAEERQQLVRQALARMAKRDVEILLLKYTEDWSYRELAQHLGISESAVEARLHRARGRLRDQLAALSVTAAQA
jgi:RNA polymerase sigma factor (sigma-70 family)